MSKARNLRYVGTLFIVAMVGVSGVSGRSEAQSTASGPVPPQTIQSLPSKMTIAAPGTTQNVPPKGTAADPLVEGISIAVGNGVLLHLPQPATTVLSADPAIARVQPASPTSLFLTGVAAGQTTIVATDEEGTEIVQYNVSVGHGRGGGGGGGGGKPALGATATMALAAQAAIMQSIPDAGTVTVAADGTGLILRGTIKTALEAQQAEAIARGFAGAQASVLDQMTILSGLQVNVRVRVAEINRQVTRQLGINWQALGNSSSFKFGFFQGAVATAGTVLNPVQALGLSPFGTASQAPEQLGLGFKTGSTNVDGIIDALAADQLITILAEPNLTALSGESASFLAGGEFPVPVSGSSGNGSPTISVSFKQFGVSLTVVPTVLGPNRINLRVSPEVSSLSTQGAVSIPLGGGSLVIPALTVQRAETTIELGSGQSFAIAGLLEKTTSQDQEGLPYLANLPVLGALFKSVNFQRGETELVIICTPYLVNPANNPADVHTPADSFEPATNLDQILLGHQIAATTSSAAPVDAGFIIK